jgi:hypothetical protein
MWDLRASSQHERQSNNTCRRHKAKEGVVPHAHAAGTIKHKVQPVLPLEGRWRTGIALGLASAPKHQPVPCYTIHKFTWGSRGAQGEATRVQR